LKTCLVWVRFLWLALCLLGLWDICTAFNTAAYWKIWREMDWLTMCLGVLLDTLLTFAAHARRLSGKSFYHLRQMNTVHKSLTEDAATTMVPHAFVTSRVDYCNTVLHRVSAPLSSLYRTCSALQLESYCVSGSSTTSRVTDWRSRSTTLAVRSAENWIQCVCPGVQVSASGCTNMPTSLNCAHRCLNQPIVVTSIQLLEVTLQFHAEWEQWDMAKDVLPFLVQHSGIHSHCLFVIHHWHWFSSVHIWRLCYSAEHTKH